VLCAARNAAGNERSLAAVAGICSSVLGCSQDLAFCIGDLGDEVLCGVQGHGRESVNKIPQNSVTVCNSEIMMSDRNQKQETHQEMR